MTRLFGSRLQPGAFFFLQPKVQNKPRTEESAVETATAVEIDKGRLRQLLLNDFHKRFGKAFAKTAPAFPPLPQRRRRPSSLEKAITNKPPNTKFRLLPYDLTSSYVEGEAAKNPMMRRGYSRDHRPDCKQVVIALIVNVEGFPLSYETLDGDRNDVTTLEVLMRMVERKYGRARRVWVFDRGIVSEANLEALRRRGGEYLVGTPRSKRKSSKRPYWRTSGN